MENSPNTKAIRSDDRKLWIGNLDHRITEGYAFVTYSDSRDALKAKSLLHNKLVGQKKVVVMWAHNAQDLDTEKTPCKPCVTIPALALNKSLKKTDRSSQIQAIETKLKLMERREDELKINDSIASKPAIIQQFQFNKDKINVEKSHTRHLRYKKAYVKKK
ncbi:hypothetical protein ABEB36_011822 [Hypothenemus hampei]|uniref:RRM domain-containing protein n=1 Tax=Hypothenemus hampei TaxID=57062 RepID=A0ABD1E949_HYPHA